MTAKKPRTSRAGGRQTAKTRQQGGTPAETARAAQAATETADRAEAWEAKVKAILDSRLESLTEATVPTADVLSATWAEVADAADMTDRQQASGAIRAMGRLLSRVPTKERAKEITASANRAHTILWDQHDLLRGLGAKEAECADVLGISVARVRQFNQSTNLVETAKDNGMTLSRSDAERVVTGRAQGTKSAVEAALKAKDQAKVDSLIAAKVKETKAKETKAKETKDTTTSDVILGHTAALKAALGVKVRATDAAAYVAAVEALVGVTEALQAKAAEVAATLPTETKAGQAA